MTTDPSSRVTRRGLLIAGASVVALGGVTALAINESVLPGRSTMYRVLGLDGPRGVIPRIQPGPMAKGNFASEKRLGAQCGWAISYPPGSSEGDHLPVMVALHGVGETHASAFGSRLGLDRFLAQAVEAGSAPFAIAAVDGGNTYWHHRMSGEDAGAMVTEEFVPLLASHGLDTARIALFGWSMGGFGALHLAGKLGAKRVPVVVAESPALWFRADQSAHGAFDSAADFDAMTPLGKQKRLDGIDVRIDCGTGDGFYPTAANYVDGFSRRPAGDFTAGGHDFDLWRRMAPDQLTYVAARLA